jgi:hypothetical protein
MANGRVRHMFPGGNTSLGFYSFYDNILPQDEARRIIVIKGGPGVGKSTFMKKIAEVMLEKGYDAEFMHCSSDNNSLDGVVFPGIRVALVDGTAPHVVDPRNPGAVDEIINLGDHWNEEGMRKNKDAILNVNKNVGRLFARAYRYLKAAAQLYEDTAVINSWALNPSEVNKLSDRVISELFSGESPVNTEGRKRQLFASAITPEGLKNYLPSILTTGKVYEAKGTQGSGTELFLEKVRAAACERGYYTEAFYCALNPGKIEHLVIPQKDVSFTTSNKYHDAGAEAYMTLDFNDYLNNTILDEYAPVLEYNRNMLDELLNRAVNTISGAKAKHDLMETYYIPNMDFSQVQKRWDDTMERILRYAEEIR